MTRRSAATASAAKNARKRRLRFSPKTRHKIAAVANLASQYYREHGRDFPWRHERDGFRLAIAEILLQKTRAESVVPVYERIITTFRTPKILASADPGEIERILHPLGLSRKRAFQLVGMAEAVGILGSRIFGDWQKLLTLVPGIGAYGARAIACFGGGQRLGIVDANVARILRRLFRIRNDDVRAPIYQRYADELGVVASDTRASNFGLLDIGADICVKVPKCAICPFSRFCLRYGVRSMPVFQGG